MAKFSELHLRLEELARNFLAAPSEENSAALLAEFTHLIISDADVLIDGIPLEDGDTRVDPGGYTGPDGRFYIHIFSSIVQFQASDADHPMVTKLKSILDIVFANDQIGGLSLNYKKGKGTILISKEDIMDSLQAVLETDKKAEEN